MPYRGHRACVRAARSCWSRLWSWQPATCSAWPEGVNHLTQMYRRAELCRLLGDDPTSRIQFSEEFTGSGAAFLKACADNNLEGLVSKLNIAPYRSGRPRLG